MPVVAMVDGVKIEFYPDEHPPPHFHARYAEYVAQIEIRTAKVLRGSLPPAKLRVVLEWAAGHYIGLMNAWTAVEELRKPEKIDD
ncbi:uncharacterized protein DUF4160 [Rhodopseudomonas thermotolerans]|uniref:Uncharacterized protein DUF4160 n=2 Tax=Rhodopseudomonas TaxID=1073 RepID=A0A336JSM2_9BRAD|nr:MULTISPECIES: DUF4160 domain-containing protein [Rhodopseudomonas]RED28616.1 uncharacterized protein DUF4160 [Rhodopseudomonas pentothenatexigens]REF91535.1 uncharacterized protein DUF4160 [Rhodopseudomonas thermotolerans]SSW92558.1 uncharacterized protein DUF4160 [Rhodopseudomonas pentothenatexigens]